MAGVLVSHALHVVTLLGECVRARHLYNPPQYPLAIIYFLKALYFEPLLQLHMRFLCCSEL